MGKIQENAGGIEEMISAQQIDLITGIIRVMQDNRVTVSEVQEIASIGSSLIIAAFVGGFTGMMVRNMASEVLGPEQAKNIQSVINLALPQTQHQETPQELFEAREFHRLTRDEMLRLAREANLRAGFTWDKTAEKRTERLHRRTVENAIRAGVPVPEEVLRDYPDLISQLPQTQGTDEKHRDINFEEYLPASIPRDDLMRIADKYGTWAAKLAESVCPHNDVACVEREARRLAEVRRARMGE